MSVLINGMRIPGSCNVCPMLGMPEVRCLYTCRMLDRDDFYKARGDNCPLVEIPPHGRLIDERVAYDKIAEQEGGYYMDMDGVDRGLQETPTVIEAEEDYED